MVVDLGGTNVRAAVVTSDGTIVRRDRRPTPAADPEPQIIAELVTEVAQMAGPDGPPLLDQVVIGIPGVIDHEAGALVEAPNLPSGWIPRLTNRWLAQQVGAPVSLANDADLAAVGEAVFGAGRHHRDVVYVTVSTGVGAGIVVDGILVRGRYSGGEIGHMVIDRSAAAAGGPATVEELGAGPAIARGAQARGLTERDAALADRVRAEDPDAVAVWLEAIEAVALGVVNVAWLVTPQVVVVGGGVGRNHDLVAPILTRTLARHGPSLDPPIEVVPAALGDDAALVGGAAWRTALGAGSRVGRRS